MDNPRKMIQRFANGIWSIEFHMTMIRTWALCVAKHYDEHAESWFTTQSKPSSERILAVRRVLDDLARDVSAHIVAPPNQTGAQWVLGVLELADGACTFAIHTDNFFVSCDCDSASDEDPFPVSSRIITEESVETVCQRHDYARIQRGLTEASRYAYCAAVLATNVTNAPSGKAADEDEIPPAPRKLPTRPPNKAFQAWQLRELLGISNQQEIANKMTEQGVPATQGQVSRWLAAVEEWRTAGGVMPELGSLNGKPQSVDPDVLDMGARQDGLTPRQRPRRDSDADE